MIWLESIGAAVIVWLLVIFVFGYGLQNWGK